MIQTQTIGAVQVAWEETRLTVKRTTASQWSTLLTYGFWLPIVGWFAFFGYQRHHWLMAVINTLLILFNLLAVGVTVMNWREMLILDRSANLVRARTKDFGSLNEIAGAEVVKSGAAFVVKLRRTDGVLIQPAQLLLSLFKTEAQAQQLAAIVNTFLGRTTVGVWPPPPMVA